MLERSVHTSTVRILTCSCHNEYRSHFNGSNYNECHSVNTFTWCVKGLSRLNLKGTKRRFFYLTSDPILTSCSLSTFNNDFPFLLGEVFVLDDGGEVDLDLGNYERFLDVTLHRDNNITTGKIYKQVIEKEREGSYLGKTVQGQLAFAFR